MRYPFFYSVRRIPHRAKLDGDEGKFLDTASAEDFDRAQSKARHLAQKTSQIPRGFSARTFYRCYLRRYSTRSGLTLLEAAISIGIFALIAVVMYSLQIDFVNVTRTVTGQLMSQADARKAVAQMIAEIREAAPSDAGSYPIEAAATSSMTFYSNVDSDSSHERVRYFVACATLRRGVIKAVAGTPPTYPAASETVTDLTGSLVSTTTPIFSYYDKNYSGTSSPLAIPVDLLAVRLVAVSLAVDLTSKSPVPITVNSAVAIRNLKDNY